VRWGRGAGPLEFLKSNARPLLFPSITRAKAGSVAACIWATRMRCPSWPQPSRSPRLRAREPSAPDSRAPDAGAARCKFHPRRDAESGRVSIGADVSRTGGLERRGSCDRGDRSSRLLIGAHDGPFRLVMTSGVSKTCSANRGCDQPASRRLTGSVGRHGQRCPALESLT
jgi:hypothetical protein